MTAIKKYKSLDDYIRNAEKEIDRLSKNLDLSIKKLEEIARRNK